MTYRVVFHPKARQDALDAAEYIASQGKPETAAEWYIALSNAVASLTSMPERCPLARENDRFPQQELRQLIFKSHRIIFTIRTDTVRILHVRHMSGADRVSNGAEE